ncbi:MAG: hypothetical protein ACSHX6_07800 [Akkermansiaceae bacterium]
MNRLSLTFIILLSWLSITNAQEILARPVIIGASVSDGYDHTEKLGGPKSDALALDHYLQKCLQTPAANFANFSNRFCFIHPLGISHKQVSDALKAKPSVIIAVDQLFWQLYGNFSSSEQRLITFQAALEKLDPITCPLVIGNIPDASHSLNKMLAASQIPNLETVEKANQLLTSWVKKRKQTAIIDLASFMKLSVSNKEIKLKHITYPAGTTKQFLQTDMLHPTEVGATAISYAVIESLQTISELKDTNLKLPTQKPPLSGAH